MKNMKYLRTWLVVALVVTIIGSLTGGTVAWFTDSVEITGNIIKTGTLDVEMGYKTNLSDAAWQNADSGAIFDYKYWEPGYTQVRYVNIQNVGDLAFKFKLNVKPSSVLGTVTEENGEIIFTPNEPAPEFPLEGVIDVYMLPVGEDFVAPTSFADLKSKVEALYGADYDAPSILELIGDKDGAAYGVMLPAEGKGSDNHIENPEGALVGEQVFMIALHMQEEADNRYQNMSIGDGFAIQLEAAQYMYEKDSFDEQYDKAAEYAGLPSAVVVALDEEAFAASGLPENAAAYMFRTTDTPDVQANPELLSNPYRYWHADFVVTFDRSVAEGTVTLAGQYNQWSEKWVSFSSMENYAAGQEIRLLGEVGKLVNSGNPVYINYEQLAVIQKFCCGAYAQEGTNSGTTMTVELRLYETKSQEESENNSVNEETGYYETIGSFSHTF